VPAPEDRSPVPPDGAAVADAFDLGRPIGPPTYAARGELGRIWRLETSRGIWAVKELFRPADDDAARADVAFQEAAIDAGVPMPRPIIGRDGHVVERVGEGDATPQVRVYTWLDLAGPEDFAPAEDAAAILGRLHALVHPDPRPVDPWFTTPVDPRRWEELTARALSEGRDWAPILAEFVPRVLGMQDIVAAGVHNPTIRCHLDFNPENVLVDTSGRTVVVDWENSGPAAAEQELGAAIGDFVYDPAATPAFLRAYEEAGGPARLHDASSFAMAFAFAGNLVASYAEQALDPATTEENRGRAVHWLGAIAASTFLPNFPDAWLEAARA
jgi:Ser/Thr protein kinase RdoA (MazF antagonist)